MGSLRTLFAISVVFAHCSFNNGFVFVGPRNAVQLFYMISGFLISYVLMNTKAYECKWRFYESRALRLYPIYFVVAGLSLLAIIIGNPKFFDFYDAVPQSARILVGLSNLTLFGQDWVMFFGANSGKVDLVKNLHDSQIPLYQGLLVPQAWTLGLELTFYAMAPFVLRNSAMVVGLLILSIALRLFGLTLGYGLEDPWTYRFFPFELALFLAGALSQRYLLPFWSNFKAVKRLRLDAWATYSLLIFSVGFFLIPLEEIIRTTMLFLVFPLLLPLTFLFQNRTPVDRSIGELSYPIYIGHILVVWVVGHFTNRMSGLNPLAVALVSVFASVLFAIFLDRTIARRIERFRKRVKLGQAFSVETGT